MFNYHILLMFVMVTCVLNHAHSTSGNSAKTVQACQDTNLHLACNRGQTINVTSARYGKWSEKSACTQKQSLDYICYRDVTMEISKSCNAQTNCEFFMNSLESKSPCPIGTLKEVVTEFVCLAGKKRTKHTRPRKMYK